MKYYLKDNRTGGEAVYKTSVDIYKTGDAVNFDFVCENSTRFAPFSGYNEAHYTGDVCEVFITTDKTRKNYFEIELAPNGAVFLTEVTYFGDGKFEGRFIEKNFVITAATPTKNGYLASISVPLSALGYKEGDEIIYNAYRIDTDGEKMDKHLFALNPTLCNKFHRPEKFLTLK